MGGPTIFFLFHLLVVEPPPPPPPSPPFWRIPGSYHVCRGHTPPSPQALLEASSSAALEQQSVVQFLLVLFDPLGGSRNVLGEVGLRSPSPQQLACLAELPLTQLFGCLQKFVVWVEEGVYDFCDLPFNVKSHISYPDQQALQQIPLRWTGTGVTQLP